MDRWGDLRSKVRTVNNTKSWQKWSEAAPRKQEEENHQEETRACWRCLSLRVVDSLLGERQAEPKWEGEDDFRPRHTCASHQPDQLHSLPGHADSLQHGRRRTAQRPPRGSDAAVRWGAVTALFPKTKPPSLIFHVLCLSSFYFIRQLPASPATCPSLRWQEEVSTCPGELHSLLMDSWRATGSSTSPQLLCKVGTHTYIQNYTETHVEEETDISPEPSLWEQVWVKLWRWTWKAAGSGGWRFGTWSKEQRTRLAFKLSQSVMGRPYRPTSPLSPYKVGTTTSFLFSLPIFFCVYKWNV